MERRQVLALSVFCAMAIRLDAADAPTDEELKKVATEYYAQIAERKAAEEKAHSRERQSRQGGPDTATGRVTDRSGRPLAGATVVVSPESKSNTVLGQGRTDEQGRFSIPLGRTRYEGLSLSVNAEGYRQAGVLFYGGIVDARVWGERDGTAMDLVKLAQEPSAEKRLWGVLEVIGVRDFDDPGGILPVVFPHIGAIRSDLLAILKSGHFKAADDRHFSPEKRALDLLAWWRDPADQALFPAERRRLPNVAPAADLDQVLQTYADVHFGDTPREKRTMHTFNPPVFSPDGRRALVEFYVEYAHWGYSERLVLAQDGEQWFLRRCVEHMHWDK